MFTGSITKSNLEIRSTKSKDNLSSHYSRYIIEQPKRQVGFLFPFQDNNSDVFSIKKLELHGSQFTVEKDVSPNYRQIHNLYNKNHSVAKNLKF